MKKPSDNKIKTKESTNIHIYTCKHTYTYIDVCVCVTHIYLKPVKTGFKISRRGIGTKGLKKGNPCYIKLKGQSISTEHYDLEMFTQQMRPVIQKKGHILEQVFNTKKFYLLF